MDSVLKEVSREMDQLAAFNRMVERKVAAHNRMSMHELAAHNRMSMHELADGAKRVFWELLVVGDARIVMHLFEDGAKRVFRGLLGVEESQEEKTNNQRTVEKFQMQIQKSEQRNKELEKEMKHERIKQEQSEQKRRELEQRNIKLEEEIREQESKLKHATELDRYEMEKGGRGICLVINNCKFPGDRKRKGAEVDEKKMVDLFRDELDFEVKVLPDLPGSGILKAAKEFAARDLSHFTKFVFIIMSHGDKDAIEGVDGAYVKVALLMSLFSVTECPTLRNKPKLFFIQACRGQLSDSRKDRLPTPLGNTDGDGIAMMLCPDSALAHGVTPLEADFLLSFATVPGYKAWRSPVTGSWYIQVLADVIRKYHRHHHLLDMLTEVNKEVAAIANDHPKKDFSFQVPAQSNTLRAKVFL